MPFYKGTDRDSEPQKKEYPPIADGVHRVTVTEAEYEQNEKASLFRFTLTVDDEGSEFNRARIWVRAAVASDIYSPKAVQIGQKLVDALAYAADVDDNEELDLESFADSTHFAHQFIGCTLYARTEQREYNDKIYVDAKDFWSLEGDHIIGRKMPALVQKAKAVKAATPVAKPVKPKFG